MVRRNDIAVGSHGETFITHPYGPHLISADINKGAAGYAVFPAPAASHKSIRCGHNVNPLTAGNRPAIARWRNKTQTDRRKRSNRVIGVTRWVDLRPSKGKLRTVHAGCKSPSALLAYLTFQSELAQVLLMTCGVMRMM